MITITDGTKTHIIDSKKVDIAESDVLDFYLWIVNAAEEKIRRVLHRVISAQTKYDPSKLTAQEKDDLAKNVLKFKRVKDKPPLTEE